MGGEVGVGLVGTGWGIRAQLPLFRLAGLRVTAVYSRDLAKAQALAAKHNIPHAFDSLPDMCACADVQLVSVVSPTFLHPAHALVALEHGKHVLVDKPLAASHADALRVVQAARANPGLLAVLDHELRFLPCVARARDVVVSGQLGTVRFVSATFHTSMRGLGRFHSWWHEADKGGGVVGALGVHVVDLCAHLLGWDPVQRLTAHRGCVDTHKPVRGRQGETRAVTAEDWFTAAGVTGKGVGVSVSVNGAVLTPPVRVVTIGGTNGTLVLDLNQMSVLAKDVANKTIEKSKDKPSNPEAFLEGTILLARALRDAFATTPPNFDDVRRLACSVEQGANTQRVVDAIRRSDGNLVVLHDDRAKH